MVRVVDRDAEHALAAREQRIDFVYGFHPGKGLRFSASEPVQVLLEKAQRFYDAGVRTFAVLFDDIPSRLAQEKDRKHFNGSLARAEGLWLENILECQTSGPGSLARGRARAVRV
jgi:hypothetical protein